MPCPSALAPRQPHVSIHWPLALRGDLAKLPPYFSPLPQISKAVNWRVLLPIKPLFSLERV